MPMQINNTAGGTAYENPFIGNSGPRDVTNLKIDTSSLSADSGSGGQVDAYGYIKPSTILQSDGTAISGSGQTAYGVVFEAVQIPGATGNTTLSTDPDFMLAVATGGLLNRDIMEDNLGRAVSANELAALAAGGFKLTTT